MRRGWLTVSAAGGAVAGGAVVKKLWSTKYREQADQLARVERERDLVYSWLLLKERGVELAEYFFAHGFRTVSIFGMDRIGRRLFDELWGREGVSAVFGVELDNPGAVHQFMTVYRLGDDPLPEADCMVVCALEKEAEKAELARREFGGAVVSILEVIAWLLEQHHIESRDGAIPGWPNCGGARNS